jgi:hypothetical protein
MVQVARDRGRAERVDDRDRLAAAVDAGGVQAREAVRLLELRRRVAADAEQRDAARRRPRLRLRPALQRLRRERPEGRSAGRADGAPCELATSASATRVAQATAAATADRLTLLLSFVLLGWLPRPGALAGGVFKKITT